MSFVLFCDGGSRGNPGESASGCVIFKLDNIAFPKNRDQASSFAKSITVQPIDSFHNYLGHTTNNVAEWSGLLFGLQKIVELQKVSSEVLVLLDSELVCKQVQGVYKVKQEHLQVLSIQVKKLIKNFSRFEIAHIYREDNKLADSLVNECLDNILKSTF
jgi:ribonuclease HI